MCLVSVAAAAMLGVPAQGQLASALIREGGPLPGAGGGQTINSISDAAVNHTGGFGFQVNTTDGATTLSRFWGNFTGGAGTVLRTEGTFGSLVQTSFEATPWGLGQDEIAYSALGTGGPAGGFDSAFRDDTPVAVEGEPMSNVPGFESLFWSFASQVRCTQDGRAYWGAGVRTTVTGTTSDRGLFIEDGKGAIETVYAGGQSFPNLPSPLTGTTIDFDYDFSALGTHYIAPVVMATGSTLDDNTILLDGEGLMVDGQLVRQGSVVPVAAGGDGTETWQIFDFFGINEAGDYFFTGDTSAAITVDEFIFKNGQMLYREGMTLDGQTLSGAIEGAYMNADGDIAFIWDVSGGTLEVLYVNDQLVLLEGDLVDLDGDGSVEPNSVLRDFSLGVVALSDRDASGNVTIYFTGDIDVNGTSSTTDDIEGAFSIVVSLADPCPADIDGSSAVDVDDLIAVILGWGPCANCASCPADTDGSCAVDVDDLIAVILGWGPCP